MTSCVDGGGEGTLPKVILLHGWGANAEIWHSVLQYGWVDAETWNLPGFGPAGNSGGELDDFLSASIARLPERCILVGWSLGGMLACKLAAMAEGRVKGIITLAANAAFVQTQSWPWAMSRHVFAQFKQAFEQHPEKTFQRFCALQTQGEPNAREIIGHLRSFAPRSEQVPGWTKALTWLETLNSEKILAELRIPQLHIFARGDALVPVSASDAFARFARSRVEVIECAGHCLPVSQPAFLAKRIEAFVRSYLPIDKKQIANSFSRSARSYERAAGVQKALAKDLLTHLQAPLRGVWLDLGCGTGRLQTFIPDTVQPDCWIYGDIAEGMLAYVRLQRPAAHVVCLDAESLPLAANSLDGAISNLALQWCQNTKRVFEGIYSSLRAGGTFVANTLLEGTLYELESAWREVDSYTHVNRFAQGDEVQRELLAAGFALEEFSVQQQIDWHADFISVLKSLKCIGASNMNSGRAPGLNTRQRIVQLEQAYKNFRTPDGRWPATYVVLTFKVRKP